MTIVNNHLDKSRHKDDFYITPAWATRALLDVERFDGSILEPACGNGSMAHVLESYNENTWVSDISDRGYGTQINFLEMKNECLFGHNPDHIITNPPYSLARQFVEHALSLANSKVAMLLRLAFLEGQARYAFFQKHPPARVWVFSERITMYKGGYEGGGSGTTAYAWFVWDKDHSGPTELKWIEPR